MRTPNDNNMFTLYDNRKSAVRSMVVLRVSRFLNSTAILVDQKMKRENKNEINRMLEDIAD